MSRDSWRKLTARPRELAHWALVTAVLAAVVAFLVISQGNRRRATDAEATATAGRVQTATATAEARASAATATADALTPRAGE